MHALLYTAPVTKAEYLGGRFLAALVLHALILLVVPAGILIALVVPAAEPAVLGPSRLAAYLSAYGILTLPTAFVVTAVQFSCAALSRRVSASFVGSAIFLTSFPGSGAVTNLLHLPTLGRLLDPIGLYVLSSPWTPVEKNTLLVGVQGLTLVNRILWIGIALGVLAFTYFRFRVADAAAGAGARRANTGVTRAWRRTPSVGADITGETPPAVPNVRRATHSSTDRPSVSRLTCGRRSPSRRCRSARSRGATQFPTSMDLYRELRAVTPDSLQSLLHDLFEANTAWEFDTKQATAVPTDPGTWTITLDVQARKVVVGETGIETEVPMDDWIEVGVVDEAKPYLEKRRIRSGRQTIVLTVPQKPARAGIDPRHLPSDLGEIDNNVVDVKGG